MVVVLAWLFVLIGIAPGVFGYASFLEVPTWGVAPGVIGLESMLSQIADTYEEQVATTVTRLTALLEPPADSADGGNRRGYHPRDTRTTTTGHQLDFLNRRNTDARTC